MTNTLDRFKFNLELYNRYEALSNSEDIHVADDIVQKYNRKEDYLKPPPAKKISVADTDVGSGQRKSRKKLVRMKNKYSRGQKYSID